MYINSICYLKWLNYMARRHATETNAPGHNPRSPFTRGDRAPEPHWKLRAMERWRPRGGKGASCTTQDLSGSSWERKREGKHIQRRATHRRHVTSLGFDEEIDYICSKYNGRENGASRGGSVTYTQPTRLLPAEGMSHHTSVCVCVFFVGRVGSLMRFWWMWNGNGYLLTEKGLTHTTSSSSLSRVTPIVFKQTGAHWREAMISDVVVSKDSNLRFVDTVCLTFCSFSFCLYRSNWVLAGWCSHLNVSTATDTVGVQLSVKAEDYCL